MKLNSRSLSVCSLLLSVATLPSFASAQFNNAYNGGIPNLNITSLAGTSRNNLFAGGIYATPGGNTLRRYNGASWSILGNSTAYVTALALAPNGNVYAGRGRGVMLVQPNGAESMLPSYAGGFTSLFSGDTNDIAILPNGVIVAGGRAGVPIQTPSGPVLFPALRHFTPASLTPPIINAIGASPAADEVVSFAVRNANTIVFGGSFTVTGLGTRTLAQLTFGAAPAFQPTLTVLAPSPIGGIPDRMIVASNGDLITVNRFGPNASAINRFNFQTATWTAIAVTTGGRVKSIRQLPDGDFVAAGDFLTIGGVNAPYLARQTAGAWTGLITTGQPGLNALTFLPEGELAIAGSFSSLGSTTAANIAAISTAFKPEVQVVGQGCVGPGGLNVLANLNNPYLNQVFNLNATGMAAGSLALLIQGLTPTLLQLPAPVQQGCLLYTSQDLTTAVAVLANGTAPVGVPVPDNPALLGAAPMYFQLTNFDVGLANFTLTNALAVRFGDI